MRQKADTAFSIVLPLAAHFKLVFSRQHNEQQQRCAADESSVYKNLRFHSAQSAA